MPKPPAILKPNNFILVSTTAPEHFFITEAQHHDIVIWRKRLNNFKNYNARLHLLSSKLKGEPLQFFMLCTADLPDFICILRLLTFTEFRPQFIINLELGAPGSNTLAKKDQEAVLLPWGKLVGVRQRCKITGIVDTELAKSVSTKAMPTVFCSRAECRDFLDILGHEMQIADDAAAKKHFRVTHHIYHKLISFMEAPGKIGKVMNQFHTSDDRMLQLSLTDQLSRHQHGGMLANLWKASECETSDQARPFFKKMIEAGSYNYGPAAMAWHKTPHWEQLQAMAHVGLREYKLARNRFARAMRMNPYEKSYLAGYKKCGQMLKTSGSSTFETFKDFMQLVPLSQPKPSVIVSVSFLAGADQERHALRTHGYTEPLLNDDILQKNGFSLNEKHREVRKQFDPATFDKHLAASVLARMECIQKGVRPLDVHIGPGAAGSSQAEMMEAFQNLRLQYIPHPATAQMGGGPEVNMMLHMTDMMNM